MSESEAAKSRYLLAHQRLLSAALAYAGGDAVHNLGQAAVEYATASRAFSAAQAKEKNHVAR